MSVSVAVVTFVTTLLSFLGRGLDRLEQYDKQRKKMQRKDRRGYVQENSDEAFADLFGKPSNNGGVHKPINREAINNPVRHNLSKITVDKNDKQ